MGQGSESVPALFDTVHAERGEMVLRVHNVHFIIDFRQGQVAVDRGQVEGVRTSCPPLPAATIVRLSDVVLDVGFRLRNQDVFDQRIQLAVVGELAATVVGFRGFGEHFNDQCRVQQVSCWASSNCASPQTTVTSG